MVINREIIFKKLEILKDFIRQIEQMDFDEQRLLETIDI